MTYAQMKKKVLALIEELNKESELLTDDTDIAAKIDYVINQVMFELARMKKIPKYVEMSVTNGQTITFSDIGTAAQCKVYQIDAVCGVPYEQKASGTVIKFSDAGTAEIDFFAYPQEITDANKNTYTFDLSDDVLEIMPYGVAADLLKNDVSAGYGNIYTNRYEQMLTRLDSRYKMMTISVDGGVDI